MILFCAKGAVRSASLARGVTLLIEVLLSRLLMSDRAITADMAEDEAEFDSTAWLASIPDGLDTEAYSNLIVRASKMADQKRAHLLNP